MLCDYCRETQEPIVHLGRSQCPTCGASAKPLRELERLAAETGLPLRDCYFVRIH